MKKDEFSNFVLNVGLYLLVYHCVKDSFYRRGFYVLKVEKYIKIMFFLIVFGLINGQCQENYVINPLYGEGDDDYEECIPSQFVHYVSTLLSGYFFNVVLINS